MNDKRSFGAVLNSAKPSASCLTSLGHLTADKREIKDFPKFASQTSFIRETLYEILATGRKTIIII
jgi:hypothetical protein